MVIQNAQKTSETNKKITLRFFKSEQQKRGLFQKFIFIQMKSRYENRSKSKNVF